MKISVKVKPNSKKEEVKKLMDNEFILSVKEPAKEGKANQAVIRLLSEYFNLPKSNISIIKGHNSKNKIIQILC